MLHRSAFKSIVALLSPRFVLRPCAGASGAVALRRATSSSSSVRRHQHLNLECLEERVLLNGAQFVPVIFSDYNLLGGTVPELGHAGVILVAPNGSATYYEFGRYASGGRDVVTNNQVGNLRQLDLGTVEVDSSGAVSSSSLQGALDQVVSTSGLYQGDPGMVFTSSFPISDIQYQQVNKAVDNLEESVASAPAQGLNYSAFQNNCLNFVYNLANAGNLTISGNQNGLGFAVPSLAADNILAENPLGGFEYFGPASWHADNGDSQISPVAQDSVLRSGPAIVDSVLMKVQAVENLGSSLFKSNWSDPVTSDDWDLTEQDSLPAAVAQLTYTSSTGNQIVETINTLADTADFSFYTASKLLAGEDIFSPDGSDEFQLFTLAGSLSSSTTIQSNGQVSSIVSGGSDSLTLHNATIGVDPGAQVAIIGPDNNITAAAGALCTVNGPGDTLTAANGQSVTTSSDKPVAIDDANTVMDTTQILGTLSSSIGSTFLGVNPLERITGSVVLNTLGNELGSIAINGSLANSSGALASGVASELDSVLGATASNIAGTLVNNLGSSGTSLLTSSILADALQAAGIKGPTGAVLQVAAGSLDQTLYNTIAQSGASLSVSTLSDVLSSSTFLQTLDTNVGIYVAQHLTSGLFSSTDVGQSIFANAGGPALALAEGIDFGGQIASLFTSSTATLASEILTTIVCPIVGSALAFIGGEFLASAAYTVLDDVFGGLLDRIFDKSVWEFQDHSYDPVSNTFVTSESQDFSKNTTAALRNVTHSVTNAIIEGDDTILGLTGGRLDVSVLATSDVAFGDKKHGGTDGYRIEFGSISNRHVAEGDGSNLVRDGIVYDASHFRVIGGDPYETAALLYWQQNLKDPTDGTTLASLYSDFQTAADFRKYQSDPTAINSLIVAAPQTPMAISWVYTLAQAEAMGLDNVPAIISANNATFAAGVGGTFTVTTKGAPAPKLAETAPLPNGVAFSPATGILTVNNAAAPGSYNLVFTSNDGTDAPTSQNFTLTISTKPTGTTGVPPTSSVNTLPTIVNSSSFSVGWSGKDGSGLGIAFYNIYVSDNGGPFMLWMKNTTQTSATYTGQFGHHYSFYSLATDLLGLTQPTPTTAQAMTYVSVPTPPPSPPSPPSSSPPSGPPAPVVPAAPPALPAPPTLQVHSLLALLDSLLGAVETVNSNGTETVTDRLFGITLFVSTYNSAGNLMSVTLFGINVTPLFE